MTKIKSIAQLIEHFPMAQEKACIKRYQIYLDTGYYDSGQYNKTWDMLAWLDSKK